jgi:hypothetical protein
LGDPIYIKEISEISIYLLCVFLEIGTVTLAMKGMTWFGAS